MPPAPQRRITLSALFYARRERVPDASQRLRRAYGAAYAPVRQRVASCAVRERAVRAAMSPLRTRVGAAGVKIYAQRKRMILRRYARGYDGTRVPSRLNAAKKDEYVRGRYTFSRYTRMMPIYVIPVLAAECARFMLQTC